MAQKIKLGKASVRITPPLGIRLQGSISRDQPAWRVMDDLFANLLLFESGRERYLLICCDLIELSREFIASLREDLEVKYSLPGRNVMICASHTHTGPPVINLGSLRPETDYLLQLRKHIAGALLPAESSMQEVSVSFGRGKTDRVGMNRRLPTAKGIRQLPNPDGPIDPEVAVIRFDDIKGNPVAAIVNYSTHPTTLGIQVAEVSADYPGRMRRIVENAYEQSMLVCFTQGACGDVKAAAIGPDGNFKEGEEEDIERLGKILAGEVLKTMENCVRLKTTEIRTALKSVPFKYRAFPSREDLLKLIDFHKKEVMRWKKLDAETLECMDWEDKHINRVAMHEDMVLWAGETLKSLEEGNLAPFALGEIQVFKFGSEVALVGTPGELFSEIGKNLKKRSPIPNTLVCGYTNGSLGYIPSKKAIAEGGYEVSDAYKLYGFPACFHEDTEEMLYREINALLDIGEEND